MLSNRVKVTIHVVVKLVKNPHIPMTGRGSGSGMISAKLLFTPIIAIESKLLFP